jgi:DNA segregation ATPase FtsK/SpoIIIE-like protein
MPINAMQKLRTWTRTLNATTYDYRALQLGRNIENVARRNNVGLQVVGQHEGAQVRVFLALVQPPHLHKALKLGEQVGLVLGTRRTPRITREGAFLSIEVPLLPSQRRWVEVNSLGLLGGLKVPVGYSTLNRRVVVDFASPVYPHGIVSGMTGSGKTVLLLSMIYVLASQNRAEKLNVLVIDGKRGNKFQMLHREAHLANPVIVDENEACRALQFVCSEIENRKGLAATDVAELPRWVVFVDEAHHILDVGGKETAAALERGLELGREFGVHYILATHRPTAKSLGGVISKANLGARFTGLVASPDDSAVATAQAGAGAHQLLGRGDFLVGRDLVRVQAPFVRNRDLAGLPRDGNRMLDLSGFEGQSVDLSQPGRKKEPFTPQEIARALVALVDPKTNSGMASLGKALGMGTHRAGRLRDDVAVPILGELRELGATLIVEGSSG